MHIISEKAIKNFARLHADAADELIRWNKIARRVKWRNLAEVHQLFPDADQFKNLLIFNVRHNRYRLILKVDYQANLLLVKEFLTHKQYDRGDWKKWAR